MKTISLAFRKLKRSKTATLLGIAGLVTGLVCALYIFFWVNDETSYDRFHKNIDRIFVVSAYLEGGPKTVFFSGCPPAVAPALKAENPDVENTCRYVPAFSKFLIAAQGKKNVLKTAFSDFSLFDIFTLPFIYGNQGDPNVKNQIVLTKTASADLFGSMNPVGKMVRFNNSLDLIVAGVIDDIPHNSSIQFDAVMPLESYGMINGLADNSFLNTWYNCSYNTYGLLASPAAFDKFSSSIIRRIQKDIPESTTYLKTYLFKNGYLYEQKHINNVKIFGLIAILVLVAATLNFINLITARSNKEAKETGLRKTIGATRANIIRLIYTNIAILCLLAFLLALVVAIVGLPLFNQIIGRQIDYSALFSLKTMGMIGAAYLITTFLAGSYPVFFLSSFKITESLTSNFHSVKNRGIFRNALVVTIFVVSIILLTSTIIISKQTHFLQTMEAGFNKDQLIYINMDGKLRGKAKSLKDEIGRTPGVVAATVASYLPVYIGNMWDAWDWEGKDPNFKPLVANWSTDEDMIKTMEAKFIEGSYFSQDRKGIVINKAFADMIGHKNVVGKTLTAYGQTYQVIGVIHNIEYNSLAENCRPMVISQVDNASMGCLIVKAGSEQMDKTIQSIRKVCSNMEPDFPVSYGFVDEEYAKLYKAESQLKQLVGVFSVFSIIVLCLGLLGVVMFMTEQKTKEIGVRKCLGEQVSSIIAKLIKPFILSGLVASGIAIPVTWYFMNKWLQNYIKHIDLSWWIFLSSVIISIVVAIVTVSLQSWRAATRNPVESLRYE
jgi:putative ABC transport system permease protein